MAWSHGLLHGRMVAGAKIKKNQIAQNPIKNKCNRVYIKKKCNSSYVKRERERAYVKRARDLRIETHTSLTTRAKRATTPTRASASVR